MENWKEAKYIFVVGIGGSDLASKAVWSALSLHKPEIGKKAFFLESPDEREYGELKYISENEIENSNDFVLIGISKSGETEETLTAFQKVFDILNEKFGEGTKERVIIISTKETSLWKIGETISARLLEWEGDVGGRFSAFTTAHTTVLSLLNFNTDEFLKGRGSANKEEAVSLAKNIFENYEKSERKIDILDFFLFNSELEDLGKWCRQLFAESLGKMNESGERVGFTPTVSIGPTDLHSMLQLDLGGPRDKFTIFVSSRAEIGEGINESALQNVAEAYKNDLPFYNYEMSMINERELGKFMQFMIETVLELGKLLEVNALNQPDVENYKKSLHNS